MQLYGIAALAVALSLTLGTPPTVTAPAPAPEPIAETIVVVEVPNWDVPLTDEQKVLVQQVSGYVDIDYSILLAVMQVESSFRADAVNKDCKGLMQIKQKYFQSFVDYDPDIFEKYNVGSTDIWNWETNFLAGVNALRQWKERSEGKSYNYLDMYYAGWKPKTTTYSTKVEKTAMKYK